MIGKSWLCDKGVVDEFLASLAENAIVHVGFPDAINFCDCVVLKELDISYDIEHR